MTSSIGNLAFEIGYLNDNKDNDGVFGSLKLVIPLGEQERLQIKIMKIQIKIV